MQMMLWDYEKKIVPLSRHDNIVARVQIAKIVDMEGVDRYIELLSPEKTVHLLETGGGGKARTSKDWVQKIVEGLNGDSPGKEGVLRMTYESWGQEKLPNWPTIESCCTLFARKVGPGAGSGGTVPTYDLLKNKDLSEDVSEET